MSNRLHFIGALVASLLLASPGLATQQIQVRLDGLTLPVNLQELEDWSLHPDRSDGDLKAWLSLLDRQDRQALAKILQAPLLREQSFGYQLLNSRTGEQLIAALDDLITSDSGQSTSPVFLATLRQMLQQNRPVTAIDLLKNFPLERLTINLDGLVALAGQWRFQLDQQSLALQRLRQLPLPRRQSLPYGIKAGSQVQPLQVELAVVHRSTPLPLRIWPALQSRPGPWILLMPGLGGSGDQLSWLAQSLAERGWPVVLLEHPGSDDRAVEDALLGYIPPPGAEALPQRLADVQAVLRAQGEGSLPPLGPEPTGRQGVVLMGHSLGALTALMGSGLVPEAGLGSRCSSAKGDLPMANLSRLLQCQLPPITGDSAPGPATAAPAAVGEAPVVAVVAFNGFGSLLWPSGGIGNLTVPVLMVGGSMDLVTPPVQEQLGLFINARHPRSRLVLVEGGSHFSVVRVAKPEKALFRLGSEWVGSDPLKVQDLMLGVTTEFLQGFEYPFLLSPQRRVQAGLSAYVLDQNMARRWRGKLQSWPF
ncbi:alpha/beta hydrolase [Cyanobium sp. HWJ4-Hawea]|uniref:alpha/beta hydrolase n=1 Tax=Cyanobium sp. HWJ4-Hawea TaxID=2823713 RepID=UPI0020CCA3EF|nr:alpha/beta hydrolase [Cyanobium sp. HWJ4-Hawea]MCP9809215.1 alpha/beta hydrolase [Cyanobium sp. HWJ4-Hawea]